MERAMQDVVRVHCFGCGSLNAHGLQIKSYWAGDEVVCSWKAQPHHSGGFREALNGGIIASIVDCHAMWTAYAAACRDEGVEMSEPMSYVYVTASLKVNYLRPPSPGSTAAATDVSTQTNGNQSLNIMQVSVQNFSLTALAPRVFSWHQAPDKAPTVLNAVAADLIEPSRDVPCIGVAP